MKCRSALLTSRCGERDRPGRSFWRPAKNVLRLFLGASLALAAWRLAFGAWSFSGYWILALGALKGRFMSENGSSLLTVLRSFQFFCQAVEDIRPAPHL